jgi:hypothetical protein
MSPGPVAGADGRSIIVAEGKRIARHPDRPDDAAICRDRCFLSDTRPASATAPDRPRPRSVRRRSAGETGRIHLGRAEQDTEWHLFL